MLQPSIMKMPWAKNGAKSTIPDTTTSLGVASLSQGFPTETELPIANGGVPPRRIDFNGAFNMLSLFACFQQAGGMFSWSAQVDYDLPSIIYHNGDLWWCLQSNGVSSTIVEPGTNSSYWIKFKSYVASPLDSYPIGSYYISSTSTSPAVLFGGTWVQVKDRMILAAGDTYAVGNTGGSATKKLTIANLPSHNHTCSNTGAHTHTRGSMNITGTFRSVDMGGREPASGAFSDRTTTHATNPDQGSSGTDTTVTLNAANGWTGSTSSNGNHAHTIGNTGSATAFDVMNPYIVAYVWRRTA